MKRIFTIALFISSVISLKLKAQEQLAPVTYNNVLKEHKISGGASVAKTTVATLPFFEDFTGYSIWPDSVKWVDDKVYINNTMCLNPVSRGVATFDALNSQGYPYNTASSTALVYADSLTSKPIDLSSLTPGDSVYFSFFYQPQGNGFAPEIQDSLMLYFKKNNNAFIKVWSKEGTTVQPFTQVMIPLTDTNFFHGTFQFRFVNKASINTNDDVWNVDYIRIAANRNQYDTAVNDIGFAMNPSFLLTDYTYMTYRQFLANLPGERAAQHSMWLVNNTGTNQTVTYNYSAKEVSTNTNLFTGSSATANVNAQSYQQAFINTYSNTIPLPAGNENKWIDFQNKYYIESPSPSDPKDNDTAVFDQVFHNYLAYDDGTAEKSYYLNLFPTLPGKLAIDFHLNQPDTIVGLEICFGRQVPLAYSKYFSAVVYKSIAVSGGSDQVIYQQDFLNPDYTGVNGYWIYKFDAPVPVDAGTFYLGTIQPALSNSDSLYFGFDVNRTTNNHLYYNVVGNWEPSTLQGAVMVRPVFGPIIPTTVKDVIIPELKWSTSPGPVDNRLQFHFNTSSAGTYEIYDMQGRVIKKGSVNSEETIDVSELVQGVYLVKLNVKGVVSNPQKIIKL